MVKLICLRCGVSSAIEANTTSVLPHHPDDHALDLDIVRIRHDRLHRRVGRLQTNAPVLTIELLQRHVRAAEQRDDHLAVVGHLARRTTRTTTSPRSRSTGTTAAS